MRSFWELIPRYILKNKKRVFFMAVGIVLSISLVISATILVETIKKAFYQSVIDGSGGIYEAMFFTWNKARFEEIKGDPIIDKVTFITPLGTHKFENTSYKLDILGCDENITELLNCKLIEGKYPEKQGEIALEKWILDLLPQKYKIGDSIELSSVVEYMSPNGRKTIENNDNFILVGLFEHKSTAYGPKNTGKAYITKECAETILNNKNVQYSGYLTFKDNYSIQDGLMTLIATNSYSEIHFMPNELIGSYVLGEKILDFACVGLFIVVGIVAIIIIYNIFNVSVVQRIKDFGIIRAIGASPKRIKNLVLGEGIILGIIFIPIGILLGSFVTQIGIRIMLGTSSTASKFQAPSIGIIASLIVGFTSIIVGVYFPAKKASKISPMEAIISNNNVGIKGKKNRRQSQSNSFMVSKSRFTTRIAYLNLSRNKKRFMTTVVSLSMSIVMLMIVNYLISLANPVSRFKNDFNGDFIISAIGHSQNLGLANNEVNSLKNIDGINYLSVKKKFQIAMEVPENKLTNDGIAYIKSESKNDNFMKDLVAQKRYRFITEIQGYSSEELYKLKDGLLEGNVDVKEMREKPIVILAQNLNNYNFTNVQVGDTIRLGYTRYDKEGKELGFSNEDFIIGGLLKEEALNLSYGKEKNMVIISSEFAEKHMQVKKDQEVVINLRKDVSYEKVENEIRNNLKLSKEIKIISFKEELERVKKTNFQLSLSLYSFIFIIATISIINLINIISMNTILRGKEIGMMRALGLGNDEVRKIIIHEGLLYGIASGGIGITLGTILTYLIYIVGAQLISQGITWQFPTVTIVITYVTVIIICLISSMIPSRSLFKSSIVDSIRAVE